MITLITSLFRGDKFINFYLENITKCWDYRLCEHLIFNIKDSNSDETNKILNNYATEFTNIKIINLYEDPGIYNVWNTGVKMANYEYLLSSNVDDIISPIFLKLARDYLDKNQNINLVCFPVKISYKINTNNFNYKEGKVWFTNKRVYDKKYIKNDTEIYSKNKDSLLHKIDRKKRRLLKNYGYCKYNFFDKYDMINIDKNKVVSHNIPHCCPVWRKSLHNEYGYFDESTYGPYADYEFWLRCMNNKTLYGLIPIPAVIYYINPNSHNRRNKDEEKLNKIFYKYFRIRNR